MVFRLRVSIFALGIFVCFGSIAFASEQGPEFATATDESPATVPLLEPVVVVGTVESRVSGKSILDKNLLSSLPTGNGTVEELVVLMPGVQASDDSNTSFQGGEILPPLLSISGGRL